jgi:hypothetical protein
MDIGHSTFCLLTYVGNNCLFFPPSPFGNLFSNFLLAFLINYLAFLLASVYSWVTTCDLTFRHSLLFFLSAAITSLVIHTSLPRLFSSFHRTLCQLPHVLPPSDISTFFPSFFLSTLSTCQQFQSPFSYHSSLPSSNSILFSFFTPCVWSWDSYLAYL